jgi:hypothetical protein
MTNMNEDLNEHREGEALPPELLALGETVGRLPRSEPPTDLGKRTLDRVAAELPAIEVGASEAKFRISMLPWWIRPITNPIARVAAAVALVSTLGLFGNLDTAERVGILTERVIGEGTTDQLEKIVDRVLLTYGPVRLSDKDMNMLVGGHGYVPPSLKNPRPNKQDSTAVPGRNSTV